MSSPWELIASTNTPGYFIGKWPRTLISQTSTTIQFKQYPSPVALAYDQTQTYLAPVAQYANQFEEDPPATQYSLSPEYHLLATSLQHDNGVDESNLDVKVKEEVIDDELIQPGPAADDSVDQEPSIAFPENVTPQELKYSTKQLRDKNMSIFHRKEFAYCEVAMTVEETLPDQRPQPRHSSDILHARQERKVSEEKTHQNYMGGA
ncbi:hypothetical protein DID88_010339 [Monilinia fructigena]|uniref:Uncharacterized protein n=1 Tax=Monilinia fructigena TaxID=38457 RepID=A0A395ILV9_9HELO|nr:hypothetical protein DID88_010339 [Monilinia fructigena]